MWAGISLVFTCGHIRRAAVVLYFAGGQQRTLAHLPDDVVCQVDRRECGIVSDQRADVPRPSVADLYMHMHQAPALTCYIQVCLL